MPRTKQNHPKNLKDKIEEAQKELKDPLISQKDFSGGGRRNADKSLKRRKLIGENELKKVPKSPMKKLPQDTPSGPSHSECLAGSSFTGTGSPATDNFQKQNGEPPNPALVSKRPVKGAVVSDLRPMQTHLPLAHQQSVVLDDVGQKKGWSHEEGVSATNMSDPLEVLIQAMEKDLDSLSEQKSLSSVNPVEKGGAASTCSLHAGSPFTPAAFGEVDRSPLCIHAGVVKYVPSETSDPSLNVLPIIQNATASLPLSPCQQQEGKHSHQQVYDAAPTTSLTHTPVPSSSKALPQSQPIVYTCQSFSASVPSNIQIPVTPGFSQVHMAAIVGPGLETVSGPSSKDQKPKKQGKYVCEYCNRACAKPSVLLKHKRSHTGERPYPCLTCDFSFKTKSNLYKHKKSHAHAIKLGKLRSDTGGSCLSQDSDKGLTVQSDVEDSADSDKDSDPDPSQSSFRDQIERSKSMQSCPVNTESLAGLCESSQKAAEPKGTAALPKVVVHPVNVSPLRADSPRTADFTPELLPIQSERDNQTTLAVLDMGCSSPLVEPVNTDEDAQCESPPCSGHAQLQRQQATDFSQQQQSKCLLSPRSLGSTDSGYFSRSESADQVTSPTSPFVKVTPPADLDAFNKMLPNTATVMAIIGPTKYVERVASVERKIRPPMETKTLSLEEHIAKLISDNEAVVDNKQLDSVKPRRTSLSRRGSIDSPKSYIFKDSFQFDLKPMGRRSSSSSDIPKSPFTPTDKAKQVFLLSVPSQYPSIDCLPITRSNSVPTTAGYVPLQIKSIPQQLRVSQSFDDKIGCTGDDVFLSAPLTPSLALHPRTLVRQAAVEDSFTAEGQSLASTHSMDEGYHKPNICNEMFQRSKSLEQTQANERARKPQQNKGTMYECETCRNRYRKLENFENHKKFYCSELHGPKNKTVGVRENDQDPLHRSYEQSQVLPPRPVAVPAPVDQTTSIRKRRKMKSVGDDDDQSPTETHAPCSASFDSCQRSKDGQNSSFIQHSLFVDLQCNNTVMPMSHRGIEIVDVRLSPIREAHVRISSKERDELQRQSTGTSVIRHTNSLSRPNSFETSESIDACSSVDSLERESQGILKASCPAALHSTQESLVGQTVVNKSLEMNKSDQPNGCLSPIAGESSTPLLQSRLVRQNNIQVPEILVTEEPDREPDSQSLEHEKVLESFNWPQRSESLSKLPTEKLPPKKKRIRLAQIEHSSAESSFDSTLSCSLSRDSSLSRCSSVSASFDRDDMPWVENSVRADCLSKLAEPLAFTLASSTLGVPDSRVMRRAASEQISCTQTLEDVTTDYRSKSFDCGSVSPIRSPVENILHSVLQASSAVHIPLIERRRGPLVRQMSLKIGPESQTQTGKQGSCVQRISSSDKASLSPQRCPVRPGVSQPIVSVECLQLQDLSTNQRNHLGSQTQHSLIYGLPHPWHNTSRLLCQSTEPGTVNKMLPLENSHSEPSDKIFVPKYQLQCSALLQSLPCSLPTTQPDVGAATPLDGFPNPHVTLLPVCFQAGIPSKPQSTACPVPQILISPISAVACQSTRTAEEDNDPIPVTDRVNQVNAELPQIPQSAIHCHRGSMLQRTSPVALCPQQEPVASSKRMLSPANSLDIAMEKQQKRVKDDHCCGPADSRALGYLSRQRKLMLVRQVCTTEPVDGPTATETHQEDSGRAGDETSSAPDPEVHKYEFKAEVAEPPGHSSTPLHPNCALKLQGKTEERLVPARSPARPLKLGSSVSVVNTRDSHRLSFPSLKTTTTFTWCFLVKRKPLHIAQTDQNISAYSSWTISKQNPNPLGLPTKVVMALFDSKQMAKRMLYTQALTTSLKADILTYSSKLKDSIPKAFKILDTSTSGNINLQPSPESDREGSSSRVEPRRIKIFDGGYKSSEEYVYVRGRGRGKYVCEECGIRCKKPSMLRKHIRTHSDVRPYHCTDCNFSFKTKGNLTKHMKSKAHSKKCLELGGSVSNTEDAEDSGDRGHLASEVEDSDGPEDEENDCEEEDEEDSLAESSLSTTPISTSPQHLPSCHVDNLPSDLPGLPPNNLTRPSPRPGPTTDSPASDTDSVSMTSPVSPCRQMSIDYPDGPPSPADQVPPTVNEDVLTSASHKIVASNMPVDRGTQTNLPPCGAYVPLDPGAGQGAGPAAHLFSHLPLHSQHPPRAPVPYSMMPVGGIQLVPAGLAAYSTFVPVQAGPVQLTIPAVSVLHRSASPPGAEVGAEPIGGVLPCLPLGQVGVAGLQPLGLETLNLVGVANAPLPPSGLAINAVGLQVLAAGPASQGSSAPQTHIPGLQILNFALPALIPSLSPLPVGGEAPGSGQGLKGAGPEAGPPEGGIPGEVEPSAPAGGAKEQQEKVEDCEGWSDDEDRLVIAT